MKAWWIVFAFSAALFWGAYVVTIAYGQAALGGKTNPNSSMRAFIFIGLAYFFMAIVIPGIWIWANPSPADTGFTLPGGVLSTLAGALGALGALGVVFALKKGGSPLVVAPIVFTGAPIINVLIAWIINAVKGSAAAPKPLFFLGLALAIAGMVTVLLNSPVAHAATPPKPAAAPIGATAVLPQATH